MFPRRKQHGNMFPNNWENFHSVGKTLEEEVKKWISEGWKFRIKNSSGKKYITRRKRGKERSLGPYNEKIWNLIKESTLEKERSIETFQNELETLKTSFTTMQNTINEIKEKKPDTIFDLTQLSELKISKCWNHKEWYGNRFCAIYAWEGKPSEIIGKFPNVRFKRNRMDNKHRWRFIPHPDICVFCNPIIASYLQYYVEESSFHKFSLSLEILRESAERRVRDDHNGCARMSKDGHCTWWRHSYYKYYRWQKEDVYNGKKVYRYNVKKHPEICASCPSYTPKGS